MNEARDCWLIDPETPVLEALFPRLAWEASESGPASRTAKTSRECVADTSVP